MVPAFIAVAVGVAPLKILVFSQVALSFQLPFAIVPLLMFTRRKRIMGEYANAWWTNCVGGAIAGLIILLNALLLFQAFRGRV
jgi:manganese transport protein